MEGYALTNSVSTPYLAFIRAGMLVHDRITNDAASRESQTLTNNMSHFLFIERARYQLLTTPGPSPVENFSSNFKFVLVISFSFFSSLWVARGSRGGFGW